MTDIAEVIGWKFNDQPGMRTKEIAGVLTIVEFPGGIPSKAEQARWVEDYNNRPAAFTPLPRAAFLFMAKKLGLDEAAVRGLIARMPATTSQEIDAKDLALLVYENQQTFERDNALLKTLVAVSGLTDAQVDAAWRIGENIKW